MQRLVVVAALLALIALTDAQTPSTTVADQIPVIGSVVENVNRLFKSFSLAYQLTTPQVQIQYNLGLTPYCKTQLFSNQADFAVTSLLPSAGDFDTAEDLLAVPFFAQAVVPLFRVDGLDPNAQLTFSPKVLAQMYTGNMTRWNDPRLQALNPSLPLPNKPITVLGGIDGAGATLIFTRTLSRFDAQFAAKVGASAAPVWPAHVVRTPSPNTALHALGVVPNSIGFQWLDVARDLGFSVGRMTNLHGQVVEATVSSSRLGMMENVATAFTYNGGSLDISNSAASGAWPMNGLTYLLVRKNTSRVTCAVRAAMVKFLMWVYESDAASDIASSLYYVPLPTFVLEAHRVLNSLQSDIFCKGVLALASDVKDSFSGGTTDAAARVANSFALIYPQTTGVTPALTQASGDTLIKQLVFDEIEFALVNPVILNQAQLTRAVTKNKVELLPMYMDAVALITTISLATGDPALVLDMVTLSAIYSGRVYRWDDAAIAALNPTLASRGKLPAVNITLVVANAGDRFEQRVFIQALSEQGDGSFNYSIKAKDAAAPAFTDLPFFAGLQNVLRVSSQRQVKRSTVVAGNALAIVSIDDSVFAGLTAVSLLKSGVTLAPSATTVSACVQGRLDPATLAFAASKPEQCWPLAVATYAAVRSENQDCVAAKKGLRFVEFIHQTPDVPASRGDVMVNLGGAQWFGADTRKVVQDALNAVTCQGDTVLITLPVLTKISDTIASVVQGVQVVGCVLCVLALLFVWIWRHRSTVKSASPFFLMPMAAGLFCMFFAGAELIQPEPTDDSCNGAWWSFNLGWFAAFAPLFAKSWRIYKIFMRNEMTVLRITDRNLFARLSAGLAMELGLLMIIQFVSPVRVQTMVQPALPRDLLMRYCAPDSFTAVILLGVLKGLILVFGAIMSFTTRGVSENFNESKSIAFSIYNQLFTIVIVALIGALQSGVLNVMMLMSFTILWIALGSVVIIFAPKIARIYQNAVGFIPDRFTDSKNGSGNNSGNTGSRKQGTVLRSLKDFVGATIRMLDRAALKTYLALLQREVSAAQAALSTLNANEDALFPQKGDGRSGSPEHPDKLAASTATPSKFDFGSPTHAYAHTSAPPSRIGSPGPADFRTSFGSPAAGSGPRQVVAMPRAGSTTPQAKYRSSSPGPGAAATQFMLKPKPTVSSGSNSGSASAQPLSQPAQQVQVQARPTTASSNRPAPLATAASLSLSSGTGTGLQSGPGSSSALQQVVVVAAASGAGAGAGAAVAPLPGSVPAASQAGLPAAQPPVLVV